MSETGAWPVAGYLQDGRYGLRAPVPEDADYVTTWHEEPFPMTLEAARDLLIQQETIPWGNNPAIRLMIVDLVTDAVVGGAIVERDDNRVSKLVITVGGPDPTGEAAQRVRAAVLRLLVPWVMGELSLMTTVIDVPADETILIDAAKDLGMVEAVRLREHILRPSGRVDLLMLELVNRQWGRSDA
ncbi:MAG TPA: GNAT family protein [Thermomicrobiales bacterium]|nr:GNAT family protein [Thermomicrobiales bacterium]